LHASEDLGIQRFAGGDQLSQRDAVASQVLTDQHTPHRRRCAERRHAATHHGVEHAARIETLEVVHEDRRAAFHGANTLLHACFANQVS